MALRTEQRFIQTQRADPRLIASCAFLQQTQVELEQHIQQELLENPALELSDEASVSPCLCADPSNCPHCGSPYEPFEARSAIDRAPFPELNDGQWDDLDPLANVEAQVSLADHLRNQVRENCNAADYDVADYIIASLDARGWLPTDTGSLAAELRIPEPVVERVLAAVHTFDPPGVGARNLRECLMIQLSFLRDDGQPQPVAEAMITRYFADVVAGRTARLGRALKVTARTAEEALAFIRTRLNPNPAGQFHPMYENRPAEGLAALRPDVVIHRTELGFKVELPGIDPTTLSISPTYRAVLETARTAHNSVSPAEKAHVTEYVHRAESFIQNLTMRRETLRRIAESLAELQQTFLETGSRAFMRPLTRTQLARELELHESTISRATSQKYVQLPNQEVVSFDVFFRSGLSVQSLIEEMVRAEDPRNPLSDQELVEALAARGVTIARRTVVKYRHQLRLLSSVRRRR